MLCTGRHTRGNQGQDSRHGRGFQSLDFEDRVDKRERPLLPVRVPQLLAKKLLKKEATIFSCLHMVLRKKRFDLTFFGVRVCVRVGAASTIIWTNMASGRSVIWFCTLPILFHHTAPFLEFIADMSDILHKGSCTRCQSCSFPAFEDYHAKGASCVCMCCTYKASKANIYAIQAVLIGPFEHMDLFLKILFLRIGAV
jgi:hypothetical protein